MHLNNTNNSREVGMSAQGSAAPLVLGASADVHVTGRRIGATIVDGLFSYLVAFVTVLISEKRQRLGDMAAHTLVVHK
jgi:uncharacterized RDD family membrane protein YckC